MKIIQAPRKIRKHLDDSESTTNKKERSDLSLMHRPDFSDNESPEHPHFNEEGFDVSQTLSVKPLQGDKRKGNLAASPKSTQQTNIIHKAVDLLARREHSVYELKQKLKLRDYSGSEIRAALEQLIGDGLVSDERFTEAYVRHRALRGFGPTKIAAELNGKGVDEVLIEQYLEPSSPHWLDLAREAYAKKFGNSSPADYAQWTKRARFLQGRGFTASIIQNVCPAIAID